MPDEKKPEFYIDYRDPTTGPLTSVYSNNVAMKPTAFDLTLYFGEVELLDEKTQALVVRHRAKIVMGWLEAKVFSQFLSKLVANFEQKNGSITQPVIPEPVSGLTPPPPSRPESDGKG
jgi:hypothetical protein